MLVITLAELALAGRNAFAEGAIARADHEARSYLPVCKETNRDRQQLCLIQQRNFIEQYVLAKAGDVHAMSSTGYSFNDQNYSEEYKRSPDFYGDLGEPKSVIQSCAWRLVVVDQPNQPYGILATDALHSVCDRLSAAGRAEAVERARTLEGEIESHTTPMPKEDWEPVVRGLRD